tara:strand:+ start:403 stop:1128 length:726 start_codon:yes stop_codon:yes gene_type:complete
MEKSCQSGFILVAALIALGIATGGYFIGQTMYNAKVAVNTADVKGLAERRVQADRANWQVSFSNAAAKRADVTSLYQKSEEDQAKIIAILKAGGFEDDEIKTGAISYSYQEYRDDNQKLVDQKHILRGNINIETEKVDLITKIRSKLDKLIVDGINIQNYEPTYHFTKLNEIKPEMLKEATMNARIAANEFAENAGVKVGSIQSARQGGFIIRDAGQEYGDTAKIEKDVRVVTTITFYLTD